MPAWCVYILDRGDRYYTGITTDLPHRLHQHGGATLRYTETFPGKGEAVRREKEIKGWSRVKKERLWTR